MEISIIRHSLSYIMAQAIKSLYGNEVKMAIGPDTDTGFYYDFDFGNIEIKQENLKEIEKKMKQIIKQNQKFEQYNLPFEEAKKYLSSQNENYKLEIATDLFEKGNLEISFYKNLNQNGETSFIDMCSGPHVENTNKIDLNAFCLEKIAGAYFRGDASRKMLTRIYGLAFETKEELYNHIEMLKEIEKRDHRKIGKELKLFTFIEDIGPGLPLWLPKGNIIKDELENWGKETEKAWGYQRISTPIITKEKLFYTSEHLPHYKESMYAPIQIEGENYYIKPMNCPFHHKVFDSLQLSYKDLPLRLAEYGLCHRYEDSGSLFGLMRVRGMNMNDAHIYCRKSQAVDEFVKVIELHKYYYNILGISPDDYWMELALRNPENKKYHGDEKMWKEAEELMIEAMKKSGVKFVVENDGAAFYGPKIDFQIKSATGRVFTASTNQIDLFMPGKFELSFTNEKGQKEIPVCIHRAPLGTSERFIGFLIEHFSGAFPLWLSPRQICIISVGEKFFDYANEINKEFLKNDIRSEIDDSSDSFNKKIRNAELMKNNYILIIGEQEVKDLNVSVRNVRKKEQKIMKQQDFLNEILLEIKEKKI